jgi:hypothetical protein
MPPKYLLKNALAPYLNNIPMTGYSPIKIPLSNTSYTFIERATIITRLADSIPDESLLAYIAVPEV